MMVSKQSDRDYELYMGFATLDKKLDLWSSNILHNQRLERILPKTIQHIDYALSEKCVRIFEKEV